MLSIVASEHGSEKSQVYLEGGKVLIIKVFSVKFVMHEILFKVHETCDFSKVVYEVGLGPLATLNLKLATLKIFFLSPSILVSCID